MAWWGGGIAAVALLAWLVWPKGKTKAKGNIEAGTPMGMPKLSVEQDTNETDDYTIHFGPGLFYYQKGNPPKTDKLNDTWSIKQETTQDLENMLQITILQNDNIVFTKLYE